MASRALVASFTRWGAFFNTLYTPFGQTYQVDIDRHPLLLLSVFYYTPETELFLPGFHSLDQS